MEVSSSNDEGDTPMHLSAMGGHLECTQRLLQYGADTSIHNAQGYNPYYNALRRSRRKLVDPEHLMRTLQYLAKQKGSRDMIQDSRMLDVSSGGSGWEGQDSLGSDSISKTGAVGRRRRTMGIADAYEEVMGLDNDSGNGDHHDDEDYDDDDGTETSSWIWEVGSFLTTKVLGGLFRKGKQVPRYDEDNDKDEVSL